MQLTAKISYEQPESLVFKWSNENNFLIENSSSLNANLLNFDNETVKITFEVPGLYLYWCTPHKGMGMIGLVVVGGDTSNADTVAKAKVRGKSKKKLKKLLNEL